MTSGGPHRPNEAIRNALVSDAARFGERQPPAATLLAFLRLLGQRYESTLERVAPDAGIRRKFCNTLVSLHFAQAFLEKLEIHRRQEEFPRQIVLLGPTQAGKSTMTNWLLGTELAQVSPLAGYTVHPQGFCFGVSPEDLPALESYFRGMRRCALGELPRERFDCWAVADAPDGGDSAFSPGILWDTPDFDSVDAERYRNSVLRLAALADVIVLVLSQEKYADLSVWDMNTLTGPVGQPMVIVLNKVEDKARSALLGSIEEKWRAVRKDPMPEVVLVPFLEGDAPARPEVAIGELLTQIRLAARNMSRESNQRRARTLLQTHWANWREPVVAEHEAWAQWRDLTGDAIEQGVTLYQKDYLDHPYHYETFQRALAQLLTLLEIPGVAGVLLTTRQIVTWPIRQLARLAQGFPAKPPQGALAGGERAILLHIAEHVFLQIEQTLFGKRDGSTVVASWWKDLGDALLGEREILKAWFEIEVTRYVQAFQPEIEATARQLYEQLKQRPAILNSLRATRITADAAGLALALHSGGIGVQDFIIAPAMLSLTTMLTESALGQYVNRAATELKQRQLAAVREVFRNTLQEALARLPEKHPSSRHFNIPPETLASAEAALSAYE